MAYELHRSLQPSRHRRESLALLEQRLEPQQLGDGSLHLRVAVAEALLLLEVSHDGGLRGG